jgi:uncharacterized protein
MTMNTLVTSKPWYRERWPWLLAIMPSIAVIGGFITAWLAVTTNDGLVVDDYYKQGKAINQTKERDRRAQQLGIAAELTTKSNVLHVSVSGRMETPPGQLILKLMHPTRTGDDHELTLHWDGSFYKGILPVLNGAHYRLQLTPEFGDWRLTGEYQPGTRVTLTPRL